MFDDGFKKIIKKSTAFDKVCSCLDEISDRKTRGTYFEWFAKLVLLHDPRYANFVKSCWLLDELPHKIWVLLRIPENDIGIDLVIETHDNTYFAVQVKYRKNIEIVINWSELSTFFGLTFGISNKFEKGIFFTNTIMPTKYIKECKNIITILNHSLIDISENTLIKMMNSVCGTSVPLKNMYTPHDYQYTIIETSMNYLMKHAKGRLYMPCGTGKTLVCYWISDKLTSKNRICIVVPSLYLLSQTYLVWSELKVCNYLLVGSDAEIKTCVDTGLLLTTDKDDIKKYLTAYKSKDVVIITTYQSSPVLASVCNNIKYDLDLIIFDESHKTVGDVDREFACLLSDTNITTKKRLFTTATEKVYSGDSDDILSMDDTTIYGDVIYNYSFKMAIENKQLCDYKIIAPLINNDGFLDVVKKNKFILDKNICKDPIESRYYMTAYLICRSINENKLTHILTFNNTNDNAKRIHEILVNILKQLKIECNCYYLTGETNMKKRRKVVVQFIKDKCAIISSARIFQEGINIPIVDCVCFVDNKMSVIDTVQSVGRVLRLHKNKTIGYVIIPTIIDIDSDNSSILDASENDFKNIRSILRSLGTIDERIIDEFKTVDRKYVNFGKRFDFDTSDACITKNINISTDELIGKIGSIICDRWGIVCWYQTLGDVEKYMIENKKRPSGTDKDVKTRFLGRWINTQQTNFKRTSKCMQSAEFREKWMEFTDKYHKYFMTNEEVWFEKFNTIKKYIDTNKKLPLTNSKNIENKTLENWINSQRDSFKNNDRCMKNTYIRDTWIKFVDEYKQYFMSEEEIWTQKFEHIMNFVHANHKLPSRSSTDKNLSKLNQWLSKQQHVCKRGNIILNNQLIHKKWTTFVNDNKKYFMSNIERWYETLENVIKYIDKHKKKPPRKDKNISISTLGQWIRCQQNKYNTKTDIMKNPDVYDKWTKFSDTYGIYITSLNDKWFATLNHVKNYIKTHNKTPSCSDKDIYTRKLGNWISHQQENYIKKQHSMKQTNIYNAWYDFIKEYHMYFATNDEDWDNTLEKVKNYINNNQRIPPDSNTDNEIQCLSKWIQHQRENYNKKQKIMKSNEIRKKWSDFILEYGNYLKTGNEKWMCSLIKLKEYINLNKKIPKQNDKIIEIKKIRYWFDRQIKNYDEKMQIMSTPEIRKIWYDFIDEYKEFI